MKRLSVPAVRGTVTVATAVAVLALVVGSVVASQAGKGRPAPSPSRPIAVPSMRPLESPTPAPSPTSAPLAVAPPAVAQPVEPPRGSDETAVEEAPGQYEPEESAPVYQPRVTSMDWPGGDAVWCGDYVSNQTATASFSWVTGDADYVDLYTASSATGDLPTDGWVLAASGQSPIRVATLPFDCGSSGVPPYFAVRVVALSPAGSWTAHWWGIGASLRG